MHIVHVFENVVTFLKRFLSGGGAEINEVFEKITCMTTKNICSEIIAADSSKELFYDHENLFLKNS